MRKQRMAAGWLLVLVTAWSPAPAWQPPADRVEGMTDLDPSRAVLPLEQVQPDPPAPAPPAQEPAALSEQAARRLNRADELYRQQRFTEAALELEKALRTDPNHPRLHRQLALVSRASGTTEVVRAHLQQAAALDDDDVVTHYLLGREAAETRQYEQAITEYRVALKCSDASKAGDFKALTHFYLAKALNATGYLTAAIEQYVQFERAVAELPASESVDQELTTLLQINQGSAGGPVSVLYEKLGRFVEAAEALQAAAAKSPPDPATRERLARLLAKIGRPEEALEQARQLVRETQRGVDLLLELHEQTGNPERAVVDLREIVAAAPGRIDVLMSFVDALVRLDRLAEAEEVLSQAVVRLPEVDELRWRWFDLLCRRERWSPAIEVAASTIREDGDAWAARERVLPLAKRAEAVTAVLGTGDPPENGDSEKAGAYLRGVLAGAAGRGAQAETYYRKVLGVAAGFVPARIELARLLLAQYAWQEVIALTCADEKESPDARVERLCGQAHAGLDDFKAAEAHLNAALRADRTDVETLEALAELFQEAEDSSSGESDETDGPRTGKDTRRIMRAWESLLELNPLHEKAREHLVSLYVLEPRGARLNDAAQQVAELRRLSASPHRIATCAALIEACRQGWPPKPERLVEFRRTQEEALREHGPHAGTYLTIARSFIQQDLTEEAAEPVRKALELDPTEVHALEIQMAVQMNALEYEASAATLRELLRRHPNRQRWLMGLLTVLRFDQRYDEVISLARLQLTRTGLEPQQVKEFRERLWQSLRLAKKYDEAVSLVGEWVKSEPDVATWTEWLAGTLLSAERYDEAVNVGRAWSDRHPDEESGRDFVRRLLVAAKQYDRAEQMVLARLEKDPAGEALPLLLARTLASAGRYQDALEIVDSLIRRRPEDRGLLDMRLRFLDGAGRHAELIEFFGSRLRELDAEMTDSADRLDGDLKASLAQQWIAAGETDEAINRLNRWVAEAAHPVDRFRYYSMLAGCYQREARPEKSIEALDRAYQLRDQVPRQAVVGVHNDLGYTLAEAGVRLEEAEKLIRFALGRHPENGAYLDSLGWVLYKKGRFTEAERWLGKALHLLRNSDLADGGDNAVIYDHLGDVHWRLENKDEARRYWQSAVDNLVKALAEEQREDWVQTRAAVEAKLQAADRGELPAVATVGENAPTPESTEKPEQEGDEP